jgi:DNA-binding XRE family transcriptional regulator
MAFMRYGFKTGVTYFASSVSLIKRILSFYAMASKRKPKKPREMKSSGPKKLSKRIMKKMHLTSLDEHINEQYGKRGTKRREEFERGYEAFRLGAIIQLAREEKGLTQEKVARRAGTNKSYISKLEKDLKDVRFSTLQRIIHDGLGATLEINIKF